MFDAFAFWIDIKLPVDRLGKVDYWEIYEVGDVNYHHVDRSVVEVAHIPHTATWCDVVDSLCTYLDMLEKKYSITKEVSYRIEIENPLNDNDKKRLRRMLNENYE
jgi:hypothetical protein